MDERLFLVDYEEMSAGQVYRERHLLTEDQLKSEFNIEKYSAENAEDGMEINKGDDVITIYEAESLDDVKAFMTWKGEKDAICDDPDSEDIEYPDFIPEELRNGRLLELSGKTADYLPVSNEFNPTVEKYVKILDIPEDRLDIFSTLTDKEDAMFDIAQTIYDEDEISIDDYNDILKEHGLNDYIIKSFADAVETLSAADDELKQ